MKEKLIHAFTDKYGQPPAVLIRAPGRVNLIGEHTDYNDGFVLPLAINRAVWIALRPRNDQQLILQSLDLPRIAHIDLTDFQREEASWVEYVKGMAWALQEAGYSLHGWEGIMSSDVPIGAGLSSSAALELGVARAFTAVGQHPWNPTQMALLAQKAENEWVGMNCGIMDQMISAAGQTGQALLIDCRSLALESVPLPPGTAVIILDTATRRGLVDSAYNERRAQCETAAAHFGVPALRDVSKALFTARADELDEVTRRRARHVISENDRTQQAAQAMKAGDAERLGQLMDASHASLRDDFAVSSDALNTIVWLARRHEGCYGARMTGAGFGGCAVALVQADKAELFVRHVARDYERQMRLTPTLYICEPMAGAGLESL